MRQAATDTQTLVIQRHTASGPDEIKRGRDTSTDTSTLTVHQVRGSGNDYPPECFARHASTDTRTLISTRDKFSATIPIVQVVRNDAQTQSTLAPKEKENHVFEQHEIVWTQRQPPIEDTVEEQRQEIVTFRLPRPTVEPLTEESYETTITTERTQTNDQHRSQIKQDLVDTTFRKSELTEWTRTLGSSHTSKSSTETIQHEQKRPKTPEQLVEESYEVISTVKKPQSIKIQRQFIDSSFGKTASSEDDSSYCEEWTVTEAKRKQDGQTVKTIIDR